MTAQYQLHDAGHLRAQVPPKSRAALQVNEARLALLLQAVRTSLQMQSSSHSYRLAAVDITNQLSRCQVGCLLGSAARKGCLHLLSFVARPRDQPKRPATLQDLRGAAIGC